MFVKERRQTMKVLLLSESEVSPLLCMREVIEAVEVAFKEYASGYTQMPSRLYLSYSNGDFENNAFSSGWQSTPIGKASSLRLV